MDSLFNGFDVSEELVERWMAEDRMLRLDWPLIFLLWSDLNFVLVCILIGSCLIILCTYLSLSALVIQLLLLLKFYLLLALLQLLPYASQSCTRRGLTLKLVVLGEYLAEVVLVDLMEWTFYHYEGDPLLRMCLAHLWDYYNKCILSRDNAPSIWPTWITTSFWSTRHYLA